MANDLHMPLSLDEISIPEGRREVDKAAVAKLAKSIEEIGLRHPVTVRRKGDGYVLVAGLHRIEAFRKLGREHIPAIICTFTNIDARMWEIAENLYRADLTAQQRAIQIAEWVKLCDQKLAQVAQVSKGGRGKEGGLSAASRDLDIDRDQVRRSVKIASISDEAQAAIQGAGLENNQSAMLSVAKEATPSEQVAKVIELKQRGKVTAKTWRDDFERIWAKGTDDDHRWARDHIDAPVMDRSFR